MGKNMVNSQNGTSKLALLRQKRDGIKTKDTEENIEKAIDGYAASIDTKKMMAEIEKNSAHVNWIIDNSGSMDGTSGAIAQEMNQFAARQATKIYSTMLSLTLFDHEVQPKFNKLNAKEFIPVQPWICNGGTNIYDAIYSAITPTIVTDANIRLHMIITDGQNGRSYHSLSEVQRLVSEHIANGDHIFLLYYDEFNYDNTSESAKTYAKELGINPNNAVNFDRNGDGIKIIFQTVEDLLDGLRTTGTVPKDWARQIAAHAANPELKAREIRYLE